MVNQTNPSVLSDKIHLPVYDLSFAGGRFTGPTKEHEKLIDLVLASSARHKKIVVFGPSEPGHSNRDPLSVAEKIEILQSLYPTRDVFVDGSLPLTRTPNQALAYLWHQLGDGQPLTVQIFAGCGEADRGGSVEEYQSIVDRLNNTRFPSGDYRFRFSKVSVTGNPRGKISGTAMRDFAVKSEDPVEFKNMLHSSMTLEAATKLMKTIKQRYRFS